MPLRKRLHKFFGKRASPSFERVQSSPKPSSDKSIPKDTQALSDDNKPEAAYPDHTLASYTQSEFVKDNSNRILDLKLVHQPAASKSTDVDIIFVHGLTGNAVNTWLHKHSGTYLPELLGQDIDNARIFTFGYDADVASFWGGTSQNRLTNHADKLLGCLATERPDSVSEKRKIIFVTHSLGGLVVKRAMQMSKSSAEAYVRNIERETAAIAFLGTPHSGSDFAPFAKAVSRVLSLTGKRVNVNILDTLKRDSQVLLDLDDWFGHWLRRRSQDGSPIDLTCFVEELELPIVGRVVEEHQAKISGYSSFGLHANHMDMTKFQGEEDPDYKLFRAQITRWVGQIQSRAIKAPRVGSEKAKEFLRSLLSRSCPYEDRKNVAETRIPGTCQWFINHERFKHWRDVCQSSLLWVSADPGSGKSVLARYLVDEILQDSTKTLCYFFFKDGFADQQSVTSCLCALLHQLLVQRDDLITQELLDDVEKQGGISSASSHTLWSIFVRIAGSETAGEISCVIDALDECYEDDMSSWIYQIQALFLGAHKPRLKMLFTSRPYQRIQWEFRALEYRLPTVHLRGEDEDEVDQIMKEVDLVIQSRVQALGQRRRLNEDETTHVQGLLTAVPNRTYLWVTLTLYNLERMPAFTKGSALKLITQIPRTVDEAYESILAKSVDKQKAQKLLHIVLAATRPLTLDEISIALAIEEHHVVEEDLADNLEPVERFRDTLRDISGLLLIVVDKKVYLLHQTVREFLVERMHKSSRLVPSQHFSPLVWKHSFWTGTSHKIMAGSCFYYVNMRVKRDQYQENRGVKEISAFDRYAVNLWVKHFEQSDVDTSEPLAMNVLQFCSQFTERLCTAYSSLDSNKNRMGMSFFPYSEEHEIVEPSAVVPVLIMAAYFGLLKIVKLLVETTEVDINVRDAGTRLTPLEWAADQEKSTANKEHVNLTRYLISLDDVEIDGSILMVIEQLKRYGFDRGWHAVADVVLRSGKLDDINWKDDLGYTTLHWAVFSENMPLLKLLLAADGVDVNAREKDGTTPLMTAVKRGKAKVVKMLLAVEQVNVNNSNDAGMTPLMFARNSIRCDGREMIRVLLASGRVDLDFEKKLPKTSLDIAIGESSVIMLEALLTYAPYKAHEIAPRLPTTETPEIWLVDDTDDPYNFKIDRRRIENGEHFLFIEHDWEAVRHVAAVMLTHLQDPSRWIRAPPQQHWGPIDFGMKTEMETYEDDDEDVNWGMFSSSPANSSVVAERRERPLTIRECPW